MATNFWKQESKGTIVGYFPLVTFRLLGCYEDRNGERVIVWYVQYREKTDEEPWYTELADTKFTDVEEAKQCAIDLYEDFYVKGQPA